MSHMPCLIRHGRGRHFLDTQPAIGVGLALASLLGLRCGGTVTVTGGEGGGGGTTTSTTSTSSTGSTSSTTTSSTTTTTSTGTGTGTGGDNCEGGAPPILALVEHDLGSVADNTLIGLDVAAPTVGLTAIAHADWSDADVSFETLLAPSGAALVSNGYLPGTQYPFDWYGDVALQVPQDDDLESIPLAPGLWQFAINSSANSPAHLAVWRRQTVDGLFHGGVIDFNMFVVPGATQESYLVSVLNQAFMGFAGLDLGTVNFYELDPQYADIDDYNALPMFQETHAAGTRPAINVMVVVSYSGSLAGAGGFSTGIPTNPLHHGTYQSGMSILVYHEPWIDAMVLQHELGHMAGLFHTSEIYQAGLGDPLEDTPFCQDVEQNPYGCPDSNNLMFPYGPLSGDFELSEDQTTIIRASATYRARVEEGGACAEPLPAENDYEAAAAPAPNSKHQPGIDFPAMALELTPPVRADRAGWSQDLPPQAAIHLQGLWDPAGKGGDPFAHLERLGATDAAAMMRIAVDPSAPPQVRSRAAMAAGRLHPSPAVVRALAKLAADPTASRHDRIGALRGLAKASPDRARKLAAGLMTGSDRGLAAVARKIGR